MSSLHTWLVSALVVVIAGASAFDIVTGREHWPFSPYPMYSGVNRKYSIQSLRLYGVPEEESSVEVALVPSEHLQPFDQSRLTTALTALNDEDQRDQRLTAALLGSLKLYEANRQSGRHNGPPLQGLRLYRVFWQLDPWASNVDRPDGRDLLLEVSALASGGSQR